MALPPSPLPGRGLERLERQPLCHNILCDHFFSALLVNFTLVGLLCFQLLSSLGTIPSASTQCVVYTHVLFFWVCVKMAFLRRAFLSLHLAIISTHMHFIHCFHICIIHLTVIHTFCLLFQAHGLCDLAGTGTTRSNCHRSRLPLVI